MELRVISVLDIRRIADIQYDQDKIYLGDSLCVNLEKYRKGQIKFRIEQEQRPKRTLFLKLCL